MGKTFRRGGSEKGNYSYGKSIRDKRTRNSKSNFLEDPTFATMASLSPAQTVGAGKGPGKYPYEVTKSILGSEGKTLLECIQGGIVEKPTAISWNSWQQWRRTTSPKEETDGFRQESTIERRLHLETMVALYGTQWESESKPTESGVSAILSEPLCGQGRTSSSPVDGMEGKESGSGSGSSTVLGEASSSSKGPCLLYTSPSPRD